ncbi:putative bifunctional diguanylate cyclase/phosphodiesterase [Aquimonas voraii]|uniref:PAS domain S-box-containing protein/diguanylate cyclase (GGDEF) domain-containing protein n=1 Tax=Aquimonas voraii TaxID=265719 RepID=A0A1G6XMT5_9GAMM|nr:GGDEF and EAL domain-containing protein [Aquimonas voraii]SDD78576.1 PAS domain S-box-containing protein/diguanylate cyclase (GGDEF) domain-containing protein [Aquimonas voraii]
MRGKQQTQATGAGPALDAGPDGQAFQALVESLPLALYRLDRSGALTYANPFMLALLGRDLESARGLRAADVYPPDLAAAYAADDRRVLDDGETVTRIEDHRVPSSGDLRQVWVSKLPVRDSSGQIVGLQGVFTDLTEEMQGLEEFRLAAAVLESAQQAVMITDLAGRILRVNPAFERITGYDADEAIGQTPRLLASGQQGQPFYERLWAALHEAGHWQGELVNRRRDGTLYTQQMTVSTVRDPQGRPSHYVAMFLDVSEAKSAAQQIQHLAHHDALTGLPNRLLLRDRLQQALAQSRRHGQCVAVLFIDLDHFKHVNDAHGHHVGDQLLQQAARRIGLALRGSDTVSRQGGDEFIALLPDLKDPQEATPVCRALLRALSTPFEIEGHSLHLSASIGVASSPTDSEDIDTLLRCADMAMYEAKNAGRNRAQFFRSELEERARRQARLEAELRTALRERQLFVELQPQIDLASHNITCIEALVRWQHPERGPVGPLEFIPFAEESHLIVAVGIEVIRLACEARAALREDLDDSVPIAINVSALQLADPGFLDHFNSEVDRHALSGHQIELEITERALVADIDTTRELLQQLRVLGVKVAIDDFGTGYSNLALLHRLPLSRLKIDRSFITDIDSRRSAQEICRAVCALASSLELKVVAEGVESSPQLELIQGLGCDAGQGYVFARPMRLPELRRWLKAHPHGAGGFGRGPGQESGVGGPRPTS